LKGNQSLILMASAKSETVIIACPGCQSKLTVSRDMIGKRARCSACNLAFTVTAPIGNPSGAIASSHPEKTPAATTAVSSIPDYIGFDCRVCSARLFAEPDKVGKPQRCEECGTITIVPPRPKPKPKNIPAAMEGEQYELWEPEDQPLPSQILAAQARLIGVQCRKCNTMMYPTVKQVGEEIRCPDCGTRHTVPPPPRPAAKRSVLTPDAHTPQLDPAAHPGERPYVAAPVGKMLHESEHEAEYQRALEKSQRTGRPMEIDARGRPIMPKWPLVTGIIPYLVLSLLPLAWLVIAAGVYAAASIGLFGITLAMSGEMASIAGMCFFAISLVLGMVVAAATFAILLQIIMESSDGVRRFATWPHFHDWIGGLLYGITALMMSTVPGYAIGNIPPLNSDPALGALCGAISAFIFVPIIVLSQLDNSSPWGILSPKIIGSLLKCPFSWAFFYFENAILAAICAGITYAYAGNDASRATSLTPLYVAATFLWARLLGRLAWRLSEATATQEE
jgi:DNA-directed RNA polymerase subunit M/transcription elongation factor TFIIS